MEEALVLMEKAECYRQMNALDLAAKTLDRVALYVLNDSLRSEVFALRAACQLDIIPEQSSSTQPKPLKNPDTARWLSLIPGVGHFYTGAVVEGIFSMVLNSAAIAFIAMEWSSGLYVGAFLGGGILLSQPYLGGTERAIQLVHEYNNDQMAPQRIDHPF